MLHRFFQVFPVCAALLLIGASVLQLTPRPSYGAGEVKTTVNIVQSADRSITPEVVVDRNGAVHMVYGLDKSAYYVQSKDNGKTFTPPVKLDGPEGVTTTMGERGPKLALGKDDSIQVIWMDRWYAGGKAFYIRHTRSLDGGKTFEAPKAISTEKSGDGITLAADAQGNVLAFWHVNDERKPVEKSATWLYLARSTDNGVTFGKSETLQIAGHNGLACSMCHMRARITADGKVCLAFRSATDDIRDFYVLTSKVTENKFTAVRVNTDNWKIDYCPMVGAELSLAPDGRALCAFMVEKKIYWAISDTKISAFTQHVATPANELNEIYPSVYANSKGEILLLWQIGPMSINGTAMVKWARYTAEGNVTGEQGTVGTSSSGTKATAFVGADDNFYIVTTARPKK